MVAGVVIPLATFSSSRLLSRNSSATSIVSTVIDDGSDSSDSPDFTLTSPPGRHTNTINVEEEEPTTPGPAAYRRTRRRFTSEQLAEMEALYHVHSHPSREKREGLARKHNISLRCVTIWFQNKRQIERRSLSNAHFAFLSTPPGATTIYSKLASSSSSSSFTSLSPAQHNFNLSPASWTVYGSGSPSNESTSSSTAYTQDGMSASIPRTPLSRVGSMPAPLTLDTVASTPRTPPKSRPLGRAFTLPSTTTAASIHKSNTTTSTTAIDTMDLWEHMPGSPQKPQCSPEKARKFVERVRSRRTRHTRTLEWACAAARLSANGEYEDKAYMEHKEDPEETSVEDVDEDVLTDVEAHQEVSTNEWRTLELEDFATLPPPSSPRTEVTVSADEASRSAHDLETINAAWALCGLLGQR